MLFYPYPLLLLGGLHLVFSIPSSRRQAAGPVIWSNFSDPSVVQQKSGGWIAYAGAGRNTEDVHVLIATSPDFSSWTVHSGYDALPTLPAWAGDPPRIWAPDVIQLVCEP